MKKSYFLFIFMMMGSSIAMETAPAPANTIAAPAPTPTGTIAAPAPTPTGTIAATAEKKVLVTFMDGSTQTYVLPTSWFQPELDLDKLKDQLRFCAVIAAEEVACIKKTTSFFMFNWSFLLLQGLNKSWDLIKEESTPDGETLSLLLQNYKKILPTIRVTA